MKYPDERYLCDPEFAQVVNMIYQLIKQARFTPTEIREAAMLAQIKYEGDYPRPIMVSPEMQARMDFYKKSEKS